MTEADPGLVTSLSRVLGSQPSPDGATNRIVAICPLPLAASLATELVHAVVILLQRPPTNKTQPLPQNLEWLTCTLASAHFLPGSVAAVICPENAAFENRDNLRIVREWLTPDGLICVIDKSPRWKWWTWPHASARDLSTAARQAGLVEEPHTSGLRILRNVPLSPSHSEPRHGTVSR